MKTTLLSIIEKRRRKKTLKLLRTIAPEKLEQYGQKQLLSAFKRAAKKVPAYQQILKEHNVDYRKITSVEKFKQLVPVINKLDIFPRFEIEQLCAGATIKDMKLAMSSSGFSGIYSFGINTNLNYQKITQSIDTALDYVFDISNKNTFLINCIPMGVKVHTSLQLAETSVRSDMALAIIRKFSHKFEQTIIVSDPHFLKELVEQGNQERLPWKKLNISLISGEDWFSESFRSYLAHLIDVDLDNPRGRFVGATLGIAELDLNLFHESLYTINIRRKFQVDAKLRKALFGENCKVPPILFHYYPHRVFLEALPENSASKELVFSMLSPSMLIPLVRYNSKDTGWIFSYNQMSRILKEHGYEMLIPDLKLPLVAVGGRKDRFLDVGGNRVYPEEIKQGLYEDFEVASLTTGYFKLNAQQKNIEVQLKKGISITEDLKNKFKKALLKYVSADLPVILYHYRDFPYAMELDYERKFNHT